MTDKAWKATERAIAKILGGERVPITGRQRGSAPDIEHEWLSLEVKHRKHAVPQWVLTAMEQAEASNKTDKLPMAVIHRQGDRYLDALCVVRLKDFIERFGT